MYVDIIRLQCTIEILLQKFSFYNVNTDKETVLLAAAQC